MRTPSGARSPVGSLKSAQQNDHMALLNKDGKMAQDDCRICRCYRASLTIAQVREWESTVTCLREARLLLRFVAYALDGLCHRCGRAQELAGKAQTREEYVSHIRQHRDAQIVGCAFCLLRKDDREIELRAHAGAGTAPPHDPLFAGDVVALDADAPVVPELAQPDKVLEDGAAAVPDLAQEGAATGQPELTKQPDQAGAELETQPDQGWPVRPGRLKFVSASGTVHRVGLPPTDKDGNYVDE